ncbi:MAG: hypothetical protein SWX82_27715 [Cyanobacteriota bacterium]|nr:hypothetical protein [Cyanobacteriota bacterium]
MEEALAIVEAVLDDNTRLNDIEEFIFRECWEGKQSYEEMAQNSPYDSEYIKSVAAKLWKKLSKTKAFNEKVISVISYQLSVISTSAIRRLDIWKIIFFYPLKMRGFRPQFLGKKKIGLLFDDIYRDINLYSIEIKL